MQSGHRDRRAMADFLTLLGLIWGSGGSGVTEPPTPPSTKEVVLAKHRYDLPGTTNWDLGP